MPMETVKQMTIQTQMATEWYDTDYLGIFLPALVSVGYGIYDCLDEVAV